MKADHRSLLAPILLATGVALTASLPAPLAAAETRYLGMCNASAAVALDATRFIVADDEDNILRIYDRRTPDKPLQEVSLAKLFPGEIGDGADLEIDLEGAAALGDKVFWIGSHSTSRKGKFRPARHRLFALQIKPAADQRFAVAAAGKVYSTLIADLEKDRRFDRYRLREAKSTQAKAIGGLSIEGLAATPAGALLIGFRNPLVGGKLENGRLVGARALLVPLLNPLAVVDGKPAQFGDPIEIDLGGYGIRDITAGKDREYLIVAGPYHGNDANREASRLYRWSGQPKLIEEFKDFNAEAAFLYVEDGKQYMQFLSDDGTDCHHSFRSRSELFDAR